MANISNIKQIDCKGRVGRYRYGLDKAASCSWYVWDERTGKIVDQESCMSLAVKSAQYFYDMNESISADPNPFVAMRSV